MGRSRRSAERSQGAQHGADHQFGYWRLASQLDAECLMFPAPVVVDAPETKQRLIRSCGLNKLYFVAEMLDIAVLSVGDVGRQGSSLSRHLVPEGTLTHVIREGAVCDVLCNFLDAEGRTVPHPSGDCVMSIDLDLIAKAKQIVLACGGELRAPAILAAARRLGCNTLVTDEGAARALLALVERHARARHAVDRPSTRLGDQVIPAPLVCR